MKMTIQPLFVLMLLLTSVSVFGQDDDTIQFNYGTPIHEDSVQNFPQLDLSPKENRELVRQEALPPKVRKALRRGRHFAGWEKNPVYFDKNTKLYLVRIRTSNSVKLYGLDDNGNPVTYDEYSDQ